MVVNAVPEYAELTYAGETVEVTQTAVSKNIMSANKQKHKVLISDIPQRTFSASQTE